MFGQVEHDVGGLCPQPRGELIGVVAKPVQPNLVAPRHQRARDVELGLVARLELLLVILRRRRLTVRVEENEDARFLQAPP
jgi:hypothetical protein